MPDISTLLKQKEQELARLQKEVDALRLVAIMFDRKGGSDAAATTETARVSIPISAKPAALPPLEVATAAISNNPISSAVANSEPFGNGAAKRFP